MPQSLQYPRPQKINALKTLDHGVKSDRIVVVDAQTFLIPNFHYDGAAPGGYNNKAPPSRPSSNRNKDRYNNKNNNNNRPSNNRANHHSRNKGNHNNFSKSNRHPTDDSNSRYNSRNRNDDRSVFGGRPSPQRSNFNTQRNFGASNRNANNQGSIGSRRSQNDSVFGGSNVHQAKKNNGGSLSNKSSGSKQPSTRELALAHFHG